MKKLFIFFIITIIITSCVSNKKILSPEQLTQDKIQAEVLLGKWNFYTPGGNGDKLNFLKDNSGLWQTTFFNYASQSNELIKIQFNWKLADNKIILLPTKVNSFWYRNMLGTYIKFSIVEFSINRIIVNGHSKLIRQ